MGSGLSGGEIKCAGNQMVMCLSKCEKVGREGIEQRERGVRGERMRRSGRRERKGNGQRGERREGEKVSGKRAGRGWIPVG